MNLDEWLAALSTAIGTDDVPLDAEALHTLLDLARDSAHNVERIAAPLTTYLVGVAVGRGAALGSVAATVTTLATRTAAPTSTAESAGSQAPPD